MARLTLVRAVAASPERVRTAYRDWVLSDASAKPNERARRAWAVDDQHLRFTRDGRTRMGEVHVEGIVTFEADDRWDARREITLNGIPYARESERYHIAGRGEASDLTIDFEVHHRAVLGELLLDLGRKRLLLERSRELDRWLPRSGD